MDTKFNKVNFRNGVSGTPYALLLPLIGLLDLALTNDLSFHQRMMYYVIINNAIVLLAYRYDLNILMFTMGHTCLAAMVYNLKLFNPILSNYFALSLFINTLSLPLLRRIPLHYTKCFTFGEFAIIYQCFTYYLFEIFRFYLDRFRLMSFSGSYSQTDLFCLACFSSLSFLLLLNIALKRFALSFFGIALLPIFLHVYLSKVLAHEPISWLWNYLFSTHTRSHLFGVWLVFLMMTCTFVLVHTYLSSERTTTITRKTFHFAITFVYILGIKHDPQYLTFISKVVLFVFILVEIVRLQKLPVISAILDQVFERFRDEKDSGVLTLTHGYLLVGCSASLWLAGIPNATDKLLLASGVITVGIGDTLAAFGGYYFGRHRWPLSSTTKTYEGTVCYFLSQLFAYGALYFYFTGEELVWHNWTLLAKLTLTAGLTSLLEAFTGHVDNLVLPLVHHALLIALRIA